MTINKNLLGAKIAAADPAINLKLGRAANLNERAKGV